MAAKFFRHTFSLTGTASKNFGPVDPQFSSRSSPSPKLGRKNWQPSSSRTAFLYGNCVNFFLSNSVPSFSCAALPHRILDGKFCTVSQQPQFSSHTASSPKLGWIFFSFTAVAANNLAQFSPSSSRSTPLYRSLDGKIGSPVLRAQPSLTGTVAKFLVQLNRSFLRAALPHRNLDGKIGSPVLRGTISLYRNCVENYWPNSVPSFSRTEFPHRNLDGKIWPSPVLWAQLH